MKHLEARKAVCAEYNTAYVPSEDHLKVGISMSVKEGIRPIYGARYVPEGDTTGWFIWAGDYSADDNFFRPLHVAHLDDWAPSIQPYLGLGPGWRFLIVPEEAYIDVWYDDTFLRP